MHVECLATRRPPAVRRKSAHFRQSGQQGLAGRVAVRGRRRPPSTAPQCRLRMICRAFSTRANCRGSTCGPFAHRALYCSSHCAVQASTLAGTASARRTIDCSASAMRSFSPHVKTVSALSILRCTASSSRASLPAGSLGLRARNFNVSDGVRRACASSRAPDRSRADRARARSSRACDRRRPPLRRRRETARSDRARRPATGRVPRTTA